MTKICKRCEKEKPAGDFAGQKNGKNGLKANCKICTSILGKEYRSKPEIMVSRKLYDKLWQEKNKEHRKKYLENYHSNPANIEKIRVYRKGYRQRPEVKKAVLEYIKIPEVKEKRKTYRDTPKEKKRIKEYSRSYNQRPEVKDRLREYYRQPKKIERASIYSKVCEAVKSGRLKKLPCEVCGEKKVDGHHEDYSKPLDVIWLCRKHHGEVHSENLR